MIAAEPSNAPHLHVPTKEAVDPGVEQPWFTRCVDGQVTSVSQVAHTSLKLPHMSRLATVAGMAVVFSVAGTSGVAAVETMVVANLLDTMCPTTASRTMLDATILPQLQSPLKVA